MPTIINSKRFVIPENLIIDQLPISDQNNLFDAFSFNKLREDYTGFCVRVRRVSDDALLDVGFDGNYVDVDAINVFLGVGLGTIDKWYDQSVNNYDIFNTVTGEQPNIANGQFAGHSALIVANFVSHTLYSDDLGSIIDQNTLDVFAVGYNDSVDFGGIFATTPNKANIMTGDTMMSHANTLARAYIGGVNANIGSFTVLNRAWWQRMYREGAGEDVKTEAFRDGDVSNSTASTVNAATETNNKFLVMGAQRATPIFRPYSGDICEVIHFNAGTLSAEGKTLVENWQKSQYALE